VTATNVTKPEEVVPATPKPLPPMEEKPEARKLFGLSFEKTRVVNCLLIFILIIILLALIFWFFRKKTKKIYAGILRKKKRSAEKLNEEERIWASRIAAHLRMRELAEKTRAEKKISASKLFSEIDKTKEGKIAVKSKNIFSRIWRFFLGFLLKTRKKEKQIARQAEVSSKTQEKIIASKLFDEIEKIKKLEKRAAQREQKRAEKAAARAYSWLAKYFVSVVLLVAVLIIFKDSKFVGNAVSFMNATGAGLAIIKIMIAILAAVLLFGFARYIVARFSREEHAQKKSWQNELPISETRATKKEAPDTRKEPEKPKSEKPKQESKREKMLKELKEVYK